MIVSKYHGCGNDFIMARYEQIVGIDLESLIVDVCDRHSGIGADGLIVVKQNPLEMIYYNCDGSRAPMCGNGIRCFAKYCYDEGICREAEFDVVTLAGIKHIKRLSENPFKVEVLMGKAIEDPAMIKVDSDKPLLPYQLMVDNQMITIYSLFMTTIHTVIFVDDALDKKLEAIGEKVCFNPLFKEKTNVNFVEIINQKTIRVVTYERGVGMTLACGSGVCASALCAYRYRNCSNSQHVLMKKGALDILINDQEEVLMSGEAVCTMKGEYYEAKY